MLDPKIRVAECLCQAGFCLEVAERVSLRLHRERMMALAREWLALADEVEAKEN